MVDTDDYCKTQGKDDPAAQVVCNCKKEMDALLDEHNETKASDNAQKDWILNYPKFVDEWQAESNRLDGLLSWQDPDFKADSEDHFKKWEGNNKSVMAYNLFMKNEFDGMGSGETIDSVNMGSLKKKGGYVCNDPFHEKGGDGTACQFFYPKFCKDSDDCVGVNTGVRDKTISWKTKGPKHCTPGIIGDPICHSFEHNYTGDCKGTCTGTDCDMLWQCKLTDKGKKKRLNDWVTNYEKDPNSKNKDYSCHIPYGEDPIKYRDNCTKLNNLKLPEKWPQANVECCANVLNVKNSEAQMDNIKQNCSTKIEQKISELTSPSSSSSSLGSTEVGPSPAPSPSPAPAPAPAPSGSGGGGSSNTTLEIVGGIIGLLILLIIIGVIIFAVAS